MGFHYSQEMAQDAISEINPDIEIIGKYENYKKRMLVRYKSCGHVCERSLHDIKTSRKNQCPICNNYIIVKGINDIWITCPEVAKYLKDPEDCLFSPTSHSKHWFKCPCCGSERYLYAHSVYQNGFTCFCSSDGISSGEKAIAYILRYNNIDYYYDKSFDWSNRKRYDFYIEQYSLIIEINGEQHYLDKSPWNGRNEKENDVFKRDLAISNGISNYYSLDYSICKLDYLIDSIDKSGLKDFLKLDFSNFNMNECSIFMSSSIKKQVWDMFNNGMTIDDISNELLFTDVKICEYLKDGMDYGCIKNDGYYNVVTNVDDKKVNFNANNSKLSIRNIKSKNKKAIICLNTLEVFESISKASKIKNINSCGISENCRGIKKSSGKDIDTGKPLVWMYYEDYLNNGPVELKYNYKRFVCLNNKFVFEKAKHVSEWCNLNSTTNLYECCNNSGNYSYGKHPETGEKLYWMYYEDYVAKYGDSDLIEYHPAS